MTKPSPSSAARGSPKSKPFTRSSIRQSLNLAGKAFADVINKDSSKDSDKNTRKAKETRRLSAITLKPTAPRTSMGDTKLTSQLTRRVGTPESKTLTRSRASLTMGRASMGEQPSKSNDSANKASTLRPKTAASALPKYRPKSTLVESANPLSPTTGSRRRLSNSEDEKEDKPPQSVGGAENGARTISPLPHRVALKINLSKINTTPPTTPTRAKPTPSSTKPSSARPTKLARMANAGSVAASAIPRPASTSSTSSPHRTPRTPSVKGAGMYQGSATKANASPQSFRNESPLARHSRLKSKSDSPNMKVTPVGNMSHISEGHDEEDSDEENVELMLAPVASLAAPTPAMPRIHTAHNRKRLPPQTPTRADFLSTNFSQFSPSPPDQSSSSALLRPPQQESGGKQGRGSILSWEQLASEASRTLGEDEIQTILSDFPAPFRPGAISPTSSTGQLEVPPSPCLSVMNSPDGYGSISQVLLPDVTPSPAPNVHTLNRFDLASDIPAVNSAIVTLLRLQLAAAENMAKERLLQMQSMEEEIHNLKQARNQEAQKLVRQVEYMEEQLKGSLETRERTKEEQAIYTVGLEDELRRSEALRDQAVKEAVIRGEEMARTSLDAVLASQRDSSEFICSARVAACEWASVRDLAEMELDVVREERSVLTVLLAELDQLTRSCRQ